MPAKLIIESDADKTRQEIMFDKPKISLGRKAGNDLHFNRAEISGNHASFLMEGGHYFIQDNGSTNGTLLNGAPVVANEKYPLQDQDLVTIAPYRITFLAPRDMSSTLLESNAMRDLRQAGSGTVYERLDKVATGTAQHEIPVPASLALPENAGTGTDPDIHHAPAVPPAPPAAAEAAPAPAPEPAPKPPAPKPAPAAPRPAARPAPAAAESENDIAESKGPSGLAGYIGLAIGALIVILALGLLALIFLF